MLGTTQGTATIRVRNITIPNVHCVRLPNGEYELPVRLTRVRIQTPEEHREALRNDWYPEGPAY